MSRLEEARRAAEARLRELRTGLERETGAAPRHKGLWMLLAAGAVGLALAAGASAVRKKRGGKRRKKLRGKKAKKVLRGDRASG